PPASPSSPPTIWASTGSPPSPCSRLSHPPHPRSEWGRWGAPPLRGTEGGIMLRKPMTALSLLLLTAAAPPHASPRVEALLRRMTLDEKIGQLSQMPGGRQKAQNSLIDEAERARVRAGGVGSYLN